MKKCISLLLLLCMLCGCTGNQPGETTAATTTGAPTEAPTQAPATVPPTEAPTQAPTEAPTEVPTEAPTEPLIFTNPLTGETLEENVNTRLFAVTINNVQIAMPLRGVSRADLFFEMFVNDYCTRGLALFADIREGETIGSVRSLRGNFIDIAQGYDAIVCHAGGDKSVLPLLQKQGVDNVNVENEGSGYFFRDKNRQNSGYGYEHTLFLKGPEALDYAERKGLRITREENRDFGLAFTEEDSTAGGEAAREIRILLKHDGVTKKTTMTYDEETGLYTFGQYGKTVYDEAEKENVTFKNVLVLYCSVTNQGVYHVAKLEGSGEGYFACNGKIIPILWHREQKDDPFTFTHADGTPLELGIGSGYIAIAPMTSVVEYE